MSFAGNSLSVRVATSGDKSQSIETLMLAFAADPVLRWCLGSASDYLAHFSELVTAYAGMAFDCGTALCEEGFKGVALWLPPGVSADDDAFVAVVERTLDPEKRQILRNVIGQVETAHPAGPHWTLPLLGVDPGHQGKGVGAALISTMLERIDGEALPAYIESTNPKNLTLYERFGFQRLGVVRPEGRPPLFPMIRPVK